ncbi:Gll3344 protein [Sphingobacterium sp. JB170]|nr:Gll3344 protein [Sphingobacterium sp. JB170]
MHSLLLRSLILITTLFLSANAYSQKYSEKSSTKKIVYFGSSVPKGEGATNKFGYTSIFSEILQKRISPNKTQWETTNISIGGDNTLKVLKRYEKDLLPQNGQYVVFALALGNEGIHEQGKVIFDQFEKNMKILIEKARADGYIPVVTNSYTRNDYNNRDYDFIKRINLLIHTWDVPSINLLGAIDDLSGHWMDGYWADGAHPNDAGHLEMAYTIVPSLFDALEKNKPLPERVKGSHLVFKNKNKKTKSLRFTPEHIVHPFTTAITFKTGGIGQVLQFAATDKKNNEGKGIIAIHNEGQLVYTSPKSDTVVGIKVNDNQWHTLVLTHYYAKGITMVYIDGILQGTINEKLTARDLQIGGSNIPKKIAYKDWLFYRSAMNKDEINHIAEGPLLKSSLELYAPLGGKHRSKASPFVNLAQSLNTISEL